VNFKVFPSLILRVSFVPTVSGTLEVSRREDLGIHSGWLLGFTDGDAF
jgi:hypothetical protein